MVASAWFWVAFNAGVLLLLFFDLYVFHRRSREVPLRSAALWSAFWVLISTAFGILVFLRMGDAKGVEFFTGYLVEYSLSADNLVFFIVVFRAFAIPARYQQRCLLWGVLGALVLRGALIGAGAALIGRFRWLLYLFGVFLIIAGGKMFFARGKTLNPAASPLVGWVRRIFPVTPECHGPRFAVRLPDGRWALTPLALTLILVEATDLLFALDSIPAVFAITRDPFIVYTSNVCAVLGLRSLYFLLARMIDRFIYLKHGLAIILVFVGAKMLGEPFVDVPSFVSLGAILIILGAAVGLSLWRTNSGTS